LTTNLPRDTFSPEHIIDAYRLRWQIEVFQPYCLRKSQVILSFNQFLSHESDISTVLVAPLFPVAA